MTKAKRYPIFNKLPYSMGNTFFLTKEGFALEKLEKFKPNLAITPRHRRT